MATIGSEAVAARAKKQGGETPLSTLLKPLSGVRVGGQLARTLLLVERKLSDVLALSYSRGVMLCAARSTLGRRI